MHVRPAIDQAAWDAFLAAQPFRPFLQSWTMGEVYRDVGQTPVRLQIERDDGTVAGVCFAHVVPARRGRHLSVPYGPLFAYTLSPEDFRAIAAPLLAALRQEAAAHDCAFVRCSPFLERTDEAAMMDMIRSSGSRVLRSPLHLLAEQVWYLPLMEPNPWAKPALEVPRTPAAEDALFKNFRSTTRNLIRRAEKDGVTIRASQSPETDVEHFLKLHDETRQRHGFTPYTNAFFRAQVKRFAQRRECTVYLAEYQGQVIAASVHMHAFGETSYHHGASADAFKKIPASYLLQWTAIKDALKRGDRVYNFWGIAPLAADGKAEKGHPFAGVTLFKTGFGGQLLELAQCLDIPLSLKYHGTRAFEVFRKWRRGF